MKDLLRGSLTIALMSLAAAFLGFLIRIVLARKLSIEDFGLFYAVLAFLIPVGLLKNLGINRAIIKFIPEFQARGEWGRIKESIHWAIIVSIGTSLITVTVFYLLSDWLGDVFFKIDKAGPFFRMMLLYFLISTLGGVFSSFFNGLKKAFLLSSRAVLINLLILAAIYLVDNLNMRLLAFIHIGAEGLILLFFILMFFLVFDYLNTSSSMSVKGLKTLFSYGLPATTTPVVNKIFGRLDMIVLTYFKSLNEVGVYGAAQPFARLFAIVGSSVGKMIFPYSSEISSLGEKGTLNHMIGQLQRLFLFLLAPVAVFFIVFCGDLLSLLFGGQFEEGSWAVRLLVVGGFIHTLTIINVNVLNGTGHPLKVTKLVALNSSVNIAGNILLIPFWGIEGAAASTLISNWSMFWGSCRYLGSLIGLLFDWRLFTRILFAALFMILILVMAQSYVTGNIWILFFIFFPVSLLFYLSVCLGTRIIHWQELRWILRKLRRHESTRIQYPDGC